ncbi:hypothetical protein GEMRC1_009425 [Eukaryota sp. GEM-RC1]
MSDFLAENNPCGQALLRLVSRANAIVAELLRLSQNIPDVFTLSTKTDKQRYGAIILDFSYLDHPEQFEYRIKQDPDLIDLDEDFPTSHMDLLERFYKLFESIIKYHTDLIHFHQQLTTGVFIQHTLSGILADIEGRQLLSESLSMFAVILLLMDIHIPGPVRERLVVSFYRYKGSAELPHFDEITRLCRHTGFLPSHSDRYGFLTISEPSRGKRSKSYPLDLLSRFTFPHEIISMVLGRLRADDVYYRLEAYPNPNHRSVALSLQAAQIFLLLFFDVDVLKNQDAVMREIVDKHFCDNWIISFYLGHLVDLSIAWEPYKAARAALQNTINTSTVKNLTAGHITNIGTCHRQVLEYLADGVLTESFVLENAETLLSLIRSVNVSLRFLLSHAVPSDANPKYRQLLTSMINLDSVVASLLYVSDLEYKLKSVLEGALSGRQSRWTEFQNTAASKMSELADYFAGDAALSRKSKDQNLQNWFTKLSTEIKGLSLNDSVVSGRQIASLMNALEEVEQFHQIESSLHVKQFLSDTRDSLAKMLRVVNLSSKTLLHFTIASDFAYAWRFLPEFTSNMQERVRKDPRVVLHLRALFLKAASILEVPLVRIQQANSSDLASVANYYSCQLVSFVRKVLQVVPTAMFDMFSSVINLISRRLTPLPNRIPKDELPNFAQLELRHQLSYKTQEIALLAEGILAMQKTLVGIIEVDPKSLLEDGVEAELISKLCHSINETLVFKKKDPVDFCEKFEILDSETNSLRTALEYIQDYISIYGLKMWQKVMSRIIYFHVEQECNLFLRDKVYSWDSKYQSEVAPIPRLEKKDITCETFVGRIVKAIFEIIESKKVFFSSETQSFVRKSSSGDIEVLNQTIFAKMYKVLGAFGITGLDRMFAFVCVRDLRFLYKDLNRLSKPKLKNLKSASSSINSALDSKDLPSLAKNFTSLSKKLSELVTSVLLRIKSLGSAQLVRISFQNHLKLTSELDAFTLSRLLHSTNQSIIHQIKEYSRDSDSVQYPDNSDLLNDISIMTDSLGYDDPLLKLYSVPPSSLESIDLPLCMVAVLVTICQGLAQVNNGLVDLGADVLSFDDHDAIVLFAGFASLVRQFPMDLRHKIVHLLAMYIKSMLDVGNNNEALSMLNVIRQLVDLKLFSRPELELHLDPCVLSL